jgi:hypothetical protein
LWTIKGAAATIASSAGTERFGAFRFTPPVVTFTGTVNLTSTTAGASNRGTLFDQNTLQWTSNSARTISMANNVSINGPAANGGNTSAGVSSNLTISDSIGLHIFPGTAVNGTNGNGNAAAVTRAYGLWVDAPTGATTNYSADFTGRILAGGLLTTAGANTVCINGTELVNNSAGTGCNPSDARLKTDVLDLSGADALTAIEDLRPVSFNWKDVNQAQAQGHQLGFIAQEVASIIPELVRTTGTTTITLADGSTQNIPDTLSLNYDKLIVPAVKALQELDYRINAIAGTTTASTSPEAIAFGDGFFSNLFGKLVAWFGDSSNGIADLFAAHVHAQTIDADTVNTKTLCIGTTCVTEDQLKSLLSGQTAGAATSGGGSAGTSTATSTDTEAPVITINGANPAQINMGEAYSDLGATVSDNVDHNLGLYAAVDGGEVRTLDQIYIDTAAAGTHSIVYSATDQTGNIGTATRTVNVIVQSTGTTTPSLPVDSGTGSSTPPTDSGSATSTQP